MSKKLRNPFFASLIVAYLIFLVAHLPARQVLPRIPDHFGVSANNVTGTIWSGHAGTLRYRNILLNNVDWEIAFLPLLLAKVSLQVDSGNPRDHSIISANGKITLSSSRLHAKQLSLYGPIETLTSLYGRTLPVSPFGRAVVNLENANISLDGRCKSFSGDVQWLKGEVHSDFGHVSLGNFEGQLSCDEQRIVLTLHEPNQLGLSGVITHQANQQFSIKGKLKPNDNLPTNVKNALSFLGEPDRDGYIPIDF